MQLRDTMVMNEARIVEGNRQNLPPGVLLRVEGLAQKCGVKNANGRVYPKEVWEHVFNDQEWLHKISEGQMVGEADHPDSNIPSIQRTSHVVRKVEWDQGENVYATFDILDTPSGRILETLFRAGVKVGTSSRGDGSTRKDEESNADMVEVGFYPDTWDMVINPSTEGAYPQVIRESMETPERSRAIISAVESIVNTNPSRENLLECYTRLTALNSTDASVIEARDKLGKRIYDQLTEDEQEDIMKTGTQPIPGAPTTPDASITFMNEAVNRHIQESIAPLEEQVANQNAMIVERDQKITALEAHAAENEDWKKKFEELTEKVGDVEDAAKIKSKYEAAREKVIPQLLERNEVLQAELDTAKELVEAHTDEAETNRVSAYIESAISSFSPKVRPQLRSVLEGCADVIEVDERLGNIEVLMYGPNNEQMKDMGASTGGEGEPSNPGSTTPAPDIDNPEWMPGEEDGTEGDVGQAQAQPTPAPAMDTVPAGGTEGDVGQAQPVPGNKPVPQAPAVRRESQQRPTRRYIPEDRRRQPGQRRMTTRESIDRNRLPSPRSGDSRQVVVEDILPERRDHNCEREVKTLAESLGG
jgi:uncharacterized coiled-coil protein SlyX